MMNWHDTEQDICKDSWPLSEPRPAMSSGRIVLILAVAVFVVSRLAIIFK